MNNLRQVSLGFLAALLSAAIILGSLSLSLSESGLKLAMNSAPTRTPGPWFTKPTQSRATTTSFPGETSTISPYNPPSAITLTPMPPSTALPPTPAGCQPPDGWSPLLIKEGDTLNEIALFYNISKEELIAANCLPSDKLLPGKIIYVPGPVPTESSIQCGPPPGWVRYTILPGDTLYHLGQIFGVSVYELQLANCMEGSTVIRAGSWIYVPNVSIPTPTPTRSATRTPRASDTPSEEPTVTETSQPSATNTPVITLTSIPPTPSYTPRPTRTVTPEPVSPTPTGTPSPTETPTPTPTNTATLMPTSTATNAPSPTETGTPTVVPSNTPTTESVPTSTPTEASEFITPRAFP